MLKGRCLIDPDNFTVEEITEILDLGEEISKNPDAYANILNNKLLATLFYEPSTRTRFSFEAAMLRLGGKIIGFSEPNSSAVSKGESLIDTIRTIECYADIVVMRHPKEGAPKVCSTVAKIPIINAGDGSHQHPTQTLTDLLTIKSIKGGFSNLTVGCCGDLKFGRTVHSLVKTISRFGEVKFKFISPQELKMPRYIKKELRDRNIEFEQTENLESSIENLDILYMTRVQRERFFNEEDYVRLKDFYILDGEKLKKAKKDLAVLHPLPRVNEISYEVDSDSRAKYFEQAKYGMYVRMALILKLLGVK